MSRKKCPEPLWLRYLTSRLLQKICGSWAGLHCSPNFSANDKVFSKSPLDG